MKTLLAKAKEYKSKKSCWRNKIPTEQEMELAIAWLKGEITLGAVNVAFGFKATGGGSCTYRLSRALKYAYEKGIFPKSRFTKK